MTFPSTAGRSYTLQEIARALDASVVGDASLTAAQMVHPLQARSKTDLIFIMEPALLAALPQLPTRIAVVAEGIAIPDGALDGFIVVKRARLALAKLLELFDKPVHAYAGIHPSAIVDPSAKIGENVSIGALAYVGPNAVVGNNTIVMPHVTVGAEAVVGENVLLHPGVRIGERVVLGNRVIIHHNASIGADGFSFVTPEAGSIESARQSGGKIEAQNTEIIRINSIGTVVLEDDVEVGACTTIDRANLGATIVKKGTKIDNLVMIGHNNTVGSNCLIVSQVGISGSCKIGDRVVLAGQSGLKDHLKIGDDAIVMARAGVMWDVEPKSVVVGEPAMPQREYFQNLAYINKLKKMNKDLKDMKARLAELEGLLASEAALAAVTSPMQEV
jgi:UDP-3-O-[3-hydroxymyristoyl] glucosamine N-acyltransferase